MVLYDFECKKCDIIFEADGNMSKPPKRRKCPVCRKYAQKLISCPSFKISGKVTKISKSDVTRMYNEMIADSKARLNSKQRVYKDYQFNPKAAEQYGARKLNDKEVAQKIDTSIKLTKETLESGKRRKLI